MAQSTTTVTPPNPTPPSNFASVGATGPNPPNYTKNTYNEVDNWGVGPNSYPPPFFDDAAGGAGSRVAFATATSALASGSADTAGGTGNPDGSTAGTPGTFPGGTKAVATDPPWRGTVPASASAAHEGAGIEVAATQTYAAGVLVPGVRSTYLPLEAGAWTEGDPGGPLKSNGVTPALVTSSDAFNKMPQPNKYHGSSLSPATNPTGTIAPITATAGVGTVALTATGVGFISGQSKIRVNGINLPTTFVSSTSLTATLTKKTTAGTWPMHVVTGGTVNTADQTFTFT